MRVGVFSATPWPNMDLLIPLVLQDIDRPYLVGYGYAADVIHMICKDGWNGHIYSDEKRESRATVSCAKNVEAMMIDVAILFGEPDRVATAMERKGIPFIKITD